MTLTARFVRVQLVMGPRHMCDRCHKRTTPFVVRRYYFTELFALRLLSVSSARLRFTILRASVLLNPLIGTLKPLSNRSLYSSTAIGTLAVDGWAVTFGTARMGLGGLRHPPSPLLAVPNVTPHCQCTNFILFCNNKNFLR